jgi:hypothetical protein
MRPIVHPARAPRTGSLCASLVLLAVVLAVPQLAHAAEYHLYPPDLTPILNALPGDTFILHAGTYNRVWTYNAWNGKGGSATGGWVTIKGADGEARPLINYTGGNNVFEMPNVQYMKFQNLEIRGGSDHFKFAGTCHHITLENLFMHDANNTFVNASAIVELSNLIVRDCEMARLPYYATGEAFYLGGHEKTYQPQVRDSLIERNWIYDVVEGVEIKAGCTNITVRDNVISANRGTPSMTIYGTYKTDNNLRYRIYRNFIYNSSDHGIQCTSDAEITNNVIVNSQYYGIGIRKRNLDGKMQNITIANNTIYNAGNTCINVSNGDIATNVVIANNAFYQPSDAATAFNAAQGIAGITLASNLYYGTVNASSPGLVLGATPASVFLDASTILTSMDVYPAIGSILINAADPAYVAAGEPSLDFNVVARPQGLLPDIGAYEATRDVNPGWKIAAGFKDVGVPGDTNLDGHVDVVDLLTLVYSFGLNEGDPGFDPTADFNDDTMVDVVDLLFLVDNFGI